MTVRSKVPRKGLLAKLPPLPTDERRFRNGQKIGDGRSRSRAHSRAFTRLRHAHPEEFDRLLHEEFHVEGYPHTHSPADPETVAWWGNPGK